MSFSLIAIPLQNASEIYSLSLHVTHGRFDPFQPGSRPVAALRRPCFTSSPNGRSFVFF